MACSSKPGVKPFLDYIEAVTGEKVTQADWHDIREMAAKEYGIEGKLPKKIASEYVVISQFQSLNDELEHYENCYEAYDDAWLAVQGKPVTEGTLLALNYLSQNGVDATLAKVRLARSAKKHAVTGKDGNYDANSEIVDEETDNFCAECGNEISSGRDTCVGCDNEANGKCRWCGERPPALGSDVCGQCGKEVGGYIQGRRLQR